MLAGSTGEYHRTALAAKRDLHQMVNSEPVTKIKTETTISTIPPTIITAGTNPDSPHWPIICPTFITPRSWRRDLSDAVDKLPLSERD